MGHWHRTTACEQAVQWLSLSLDEEISRLERAALGRHLQSCAGCRRVSAELVDMTELLRQAPVDIPERELVLPAARGTRQRQVARRGGFVVGLAGMAAALASVMIVGTPAELVDSQQQVLAFAEPHQQLRFAYTKVTEIEPFGPETVAATVPTFSHRALR